MTLASIARDYLENLGQISLERYRIQKSSFSHTEKLPKDVEKISRRLILKNGLRPCKKTYRRALSSASYFAGAEPASKPLKKEVSRKTLFQR